MLKYQEEYLELLSNAAKNTGPSADSTDPETFVEEAVRANRISEAAVNRGTQILRENLFPLLDDILSASDDDIASLYEFAGKLMSGVNQKDVGLHYMIHLALMNYARHRGLRDMLIRELYLTGMSLYNLETMISPNAIRLYTTRMRMYFNEAASYFDSGYDEITDPETRGYIHRSMGNIALSYDTSDPKSAKLKLEAVTRSINILSDPDVRAKTPSLPWDLYLYKSHQERTSLLSYLRSGNADAAAFAQVLESAQIVQSRQLKAARERGEPLQPRWQYAYIAARYHCGALLLEELLDGFNSLSVSASDKDLGTDSMFSHVSLPAVYMEYSKSLKESRRTPELTKNVVNMTKRMCSWIVRAPSDDNNEQLMFYIRQFLYAYTELDGAMPFFEVLQNVFAARHPVSYVRMWIAGQIAKQLILWAEEDCPEKLVGLMGCKDTADVIWRREELARFAEKAGRLYDTGMVHFLNLEASACRGLFLEEEALIQLHAHCGSQLLSNHGSTKMFADIARGHHCRYDEKGGYPLDFSPSRSDVKQMIYIVSAADAMSSCAEETSSRYRPVKEFDQVICALNEGSGTVYAPFVVELLKPSERREQLFANLKIWKREAYLDMYRRRADMIKNNDA